RLGLRVAAQRVDLWDEGREGGDLLDQEPLFRLRRADTVVAEETSLLEPVGDDLIGHVAVDGLPLGEPDVEGAFLGGGHIVLRRTPAVRAGVCAGNTPAPTGGNRRQLH